MKIKVQNHKKSIFFCLNWFAAKPYTLLRPCPWPKAIGPSKPSRIQLPPQFIIGSNAVKVTMLEAILWYKTCQMGVTFFR